MTSPFMEVDTSLSQIENTEPLYKKWYLGCITILLLLRLRFHKSNWPEC